MSLYLKHRILNSYILSSHSQAFEADNAVPRFSRSSPSVDSGKLVLYVPSGRLKHFVPIMSVRHLNLLPLSLPLSISPSFPHSLSFSSILFPFLSLQFSAIHRIVLTYLSILTPSLLFFLFSQAYLSPLSCIYS